MEKQRVNANSSVGSVFTEVDTKYTKGGCRSFFGDFIDHLVNEWMTAGVIVQRNSRDTFISDF